MQNLSREVNYLQPKFQIALAQFLEYNAGLLSGRTDKDNGCWVVCDLDALQLRFKVTS